MSTQNDEVRFLWVEDETIFEACLSGYRSIAAGNRCVRMTSRDMISGIQTVLSALYTNTPTWVKYEGTVADIV